MLSTVNTQVARYGGLEVWEMENVMAMRTTKNANMMEVSLENVPIYLSASFTPINGF